MNIDVAFKKLIKDFESIESKIIISTNKETVLEFLKMKDFTLQLLIFIMEQKMGEFVDLEDLPRKKSNKDSN